MDRNLKRKLIIKRQQVKNKLKLLKQGETLQEDLFNPITKHLKNIEYKLDTKNEGANRNEEQEKDNDLSVLKQSILNNIQAEDGDQEDVPEEVEEKVKDVENESRLEDIAQASYKDYLDQYDSLPRRYIHGLHDSSSEFDQKYGVRLDASTEKLMIGNSQLAIDGADVIVKNRRYKGTPGLYELLFKKHPRNFTENDQENYKKIVSKTYANRRYYKSSQQIDGSKLEKYKKIIAPISEGKGMFMEVNDNKIDYIHWDDPNELVSRLRLLLASQAAGHTGHTNEINSIIEELKEALIIA